MFTASKLLFFNVRKKTPAIIVFDFVIDKNYCGRRAAFYGSVLQASPVLGVA